MPHIRGHRNGGAGGPNRNQNNRNGKPIGNGRSSRRGNQPQRGQSMSKVAGQGSAMGVSWLDVCKHLGIGCNQPPSEGWWDQYCQWLPGGCGGSTD